MRLQPRISYPIIGFLLGMGAPIGSLALRFAQNRVVREDPFDELRQNSFFYLYELIATSLAFAVAGFAAGRRADRLRQGEDFYHHLAEHDVLTGLHNGRAFLDRYQRALEHAATYEEPLALILLDVDKLKAINDSMGHAAGNQALIRGTRAELRDKTSAEKIVKRVHGVIGVANEVEVKLTFGAERDDVDIARSAVNAPEWNVAVPKNRIQISVSKGWVTLDGETDWYKSAPQKMPCAF